MPCFDAATSHAGAQRRAGCTAVKLPASLTSLLLHFGASIFLLFFFLYLSNFNNQNCYLLVLVFFFSFLLALHISNFIVSLEIAIYFPLLLLSAFISLLFESVVPLLVSLFSPETFLIFFPFSVLAPVSSIVFQPRSPHFQPFTFIFHYLLSLKPPPHRHKGLCKATCQPGEEQRATGGGQSPEHSPCFTLCTSAVTPHVGPRAWFVFREQIHRGVCSWCLVWKCVWLLQNLD